MYLIVVVFRTKKNGMDKIKKIICAVIESIV